MTAFSHHFHAAHQVAIQRNCIKLPAVTMAPGFVRPPRECWPCQWCGARRFALIDSRKTELHAMPRTLHDLRHVADHTPEAN